MVEMVIQRWTLTPLRLHNNSNNGAKNIQRNDWIALIFTMRASAPTVNHADWIQSKSYAPTI